jgi:hypothetical protein
VRRRYRPVPPKRRNRGIGGPPAVLINVIVLAGFAFTLHEVSKSIERIDALLQSCMESEPTKLR